MRVTVQYFAALRDRRGVGKEEVECGAISVRELARDLTHTYGLGLPQSLIRCAVNGAFVEDDQVLRDGDQVLLMPPVAGG